MSYPIKLKTSAKFLEELYHCEYGRFEDATNAREANDQEAIEGNNYELVFCDFAGRHKTVIEIQNDAELCETWYALASGTIGLYCCKHANTLMDQIREKVTEVKPELVKQWPNQNCM